MELTSAGSTCWPSPCQCPKLLGNSALPSSPGPQVGCSEQPGHLTQGIKWHLQVGNVNHVGVHSSAINNKKFLQKLSISSLSLFFISAANNLQQWKWRGAKFVWLFKVNSLLEMKFCWKAWPSSQQFCRPDGLLLSFSTEPSLGSDALFFSWIWKKGMRNFMSPSCLAETFPAISSVWSPLRPYSYWSVHSCWLISFSPEPFSHYWLSLQLCPQVPQTFLHFSLTSIHYFSLKLPSIPRWIFATFNFPGGIWKVYK